MTDLILAYDLGTGGVKASIYAPDGTSIAERFEPYETFYPRNGWHEQRPADWWNAIVGATRALLAENSYGEEIICLAVSGHSLGVVPIGSQGRLLMDSTPIWSDARAGHQAENFFKLADYHEWYMTTGSGFPAHLYSIFKIMWIKENLPSVYADADKFIGTKDYINFLLTGRLCTDFSYASGSGAYDLLKWKYRDDYIRAAGLSPEKFPEITASAEIIGQILPDAAKELGLNLAVKVACGGVDNACMALGAGCVGDGQAYTSLGSSAWIAVSDNHPILDFQNKPYVFTHCIPGMYVSSTAIFSAGSSFRWLRDVACRDLLNVAEPYDAMTRLASLSPVGSNKLLFNPSLAGGSSLDKSPNIRGAFHGLHLGHTQGDLIRSVMEGICLNLRIAMDVMAGYTALSKNMLIVGGGGKSAFWRSLFADIYNKVIIETNIGQDAGSLGAAVLAAVGAGLWKDFSVAPSFHHLKSTAAPDRENNRRYEDILPLYKRLAEIEADIGDLLHSANW
jgi:xylulokinase